jgi:DNA-binding NarL/FixJ family response regulator
MNIRVVIFEDNAIMNDACKAILEDSNGFICAGACTEGSDWKHVIKKSRADVVLMDIDMPGENGIDITRKIKGENPEIKILIQTIFQDDDKIMQALCAGANGYITKDAGPVKMLDAVRDVYNGGAAFTPVIAQKVIKLFQFYVPETNSNKYNLTAREKQVLDLMVKGLAMPDIAAQLYLGYNTIRSYVQDIYQKLHVTSATQAVTKAFKEKLI